MSLSEDRRLVNVATPKARFEGANLSPSTFSDVNLAQSQFSNVSLAAASFQDVNLSNCSVTDANLEGMTINGILVSELLSTYDSHRR